MVAIVRLVHPAPTVAVVALSAALAFILADQSGPVSLGRLALTTATVLGSQVLTGALNDWTDRDRDRLARRRKPIVEGQVTPRAALALAAAGGALQLAASVPLGALALLIGVAASASAIAYNLWLSRTPLSVLPYLVSFGLLPLWIAAGMDVPLSRVAAAPLLVGPFAAAAHLANTLRDFQTDQRTGSRNLAQVLGRRRCEGRGRRCDRLTGGGENARRGGRRRIVAVARHEHEGGQRNAQERQGPMRTTDQFGVSPVCEGHGPDRLHEGRQRRMRR
jgi:4-hydroxybenzoate polyprenyltransferase